MAEPALAAWGIDHHRTPVEIRERLAVRDEEAQALAREFAQLPGVAEAVVLSTCNRLECYLSGDVTDAVITGAIAQSRSIAPQLLQAHRYFHQGRGCVRHLFRVVSGLESLILGEDQIVHQVKDAYEAAHRAHLVGANLHPLFQRALGVGKEVRTETALGRHKLSVASVAVDLARHVHGDLSNARLLVIGAGEIAELTMRYLQEQGVRRISVVNRSHERALALAAPYQATVYPWEHLVEALCEHDTIISSTSASHVVVTESDIRLARRRHRGPLLVIDLAVPRDIDPQVGSLADVFLYNIDHLESVVAANRELRTEEIMAAAAVVDANVSAYCTAANPQQHQLARQVASYFRDVVAAEEARLAGKLELATDPRRAELRYGLERVANKLQHQVLAWIRAHPGEPGAEALIRELLALPGDEPSLGGAAGAVERAEPR
jgi:glutamyl-tRNA reductase